MPVVINTVEVSQEQTRAAGPETSAAEPAASTRPDPNEIRRLLEHMAARLLRLQAH
jgi:hypothetical protein